MAGFEVWDIVKVPFPYTNRPVLQHRPGLVVAVHAEPGSPVLLWVLMITSALHRRWGGDVVIGDLMKTGLPVASIVRTAKVATIEAADSVVIGRLPAPARDAVAATVAGRLAGVLVGDTTGQALIAAMQASPSRDVEILPGRDVK